MGASPWHNPPMSYRETPAVRRRLRATVPKLEEEAAPLRQAEAVRQERKRDLRGAVIRYRAARETRDEVQAAETRVDPDAAQVERLRAEREGR